jgi:hypothetical protein
MKKSQGKRRDKREGPGGGTLLKEYFECEGGIPPPPGGLPAESAGFKSRLSLFARGVVVGIPTHRATAEGADIEPSRAPECLKREVFSA